VIERIVVIADSNEHPDAQFTRVQRKVRQAGTLPIPNAPLQMILGTKVRIGIVMLPGGGAAGNLETLLLKSARRVRPDLAACADTYRDCARIAAWPAGMQDKMLLRSMIAAAVRDDPNCSLSWIWSKADKPLDIADPAFTWLVDFFRASFA